MEFRVPTLAIVVVDGAKQFMETHTIVGGPLKEVANTKTSKPNPVRVGNNVKSGSGWLVALVFDLNVKGFPSMVCVSTNNLAPSTTTMARTRTRNSKLIYSYGCTCHPL